MCTDENIVALEVSSRQVADEAADVAARAAAELNRATKFASQMGNRVLDAEQKLRDAVSHQTAAVEALEAARKTQQYCRHSRDVASQRVTRSATELKEARDHAAEQKSTAQAAVADADAARQAFERARADVDAKNAAYHSATDAFNAAISARDEAGRRDQAQQDMAKKLKDVAAAAAEAAACVRGGGHHDSQRSDAVIGMCFHEHCSRTTSGLTLTLLCRASPVGPLCRSTH